MHYSQGLTPKPHRACIAAVQHTQYLRTSWSWQGTKHAPESGSRSKSTQGMHCSSLANTRSQSSAFHGHAGFGDMHQSQCPNPKAACSIHSVLELCTSWTWQCWEKCVRVLTPKHYLNLAFLPHDILDLFRPQQCHSPFHAVLQITNFTWPIPGSSSTIL